MDWTALCTKDSAEKQNQESLLRQEDSQEGETSTAKIMHIYFKKPLPVGGTAKNFQHSVFVAFFQTFLSGVSAELETCKLS